MCTGLFMLQHFYDRGYLKHDEDSLYTTFLASSFRTLRFGLNEAHGKGMALQFNYLTDKGAFVYRDDTWAVDGAKMRGAVRDLAHDLLTDRGDGRLCGREEDAGYSVGDSSGGECDVAACGACSGGYPAGVRDGGRDFAGASVTRVVFCIDGYCGWQLLPLGRSGRGERI